LPAIVEIYNSTIASRMVTADTAPVTVDSRRAWFAAHQSAQRPLWVIEGQAGAGPAMLGWLSFSNFHERAAYAGSAELSIYLHPEARGRGIGRYMLEEAIRHAPGIALHSLVGLIFGHNLPSLKLFESAGFQRWGTLPGVAVLDGTKRDLVIVGRRVP
jgi:L-amino acid N-acyltransferase YncA